MRHSRKHVPIHFESDGSARPGRASRLSRRPLRPSRPGSWHSHQRFSFLAFMRSFDLRFILLSIALLIILVLGLGHVMRSCAAPFSSNHHQIHEAQNPTLFNANAYNPDSLSLNDQGRYIYSTSDGTTFSRFGIDVSEHQGTIDWQQVAQDGVQFAYLRIGYRGTTEGEIQKDAQFDTNLEEAQKAGIPVGVYFFSQAINEEEALQEARFVIDTLSETTLQYPIVLDFETHDASAKNRIDGLSTEQVTRDALAFISAIEDAGYSVMIYGNKTDLERIDANQLKGYPYWYAQYTGVPAASQPFALWQYSEIGQVAGIEGSTDMNIQLVSN